MDTAAETPLAALSALRSVAQDTRVMDQIVWVSRINNFCDICFIIIIILRRFLTRCNTTEVITRAHINARLTTCPWYNAGNQLRVVSGEEVCLQRNFKTVNRLLGANSESMNGFIGQKAQLELYPFAGRKPVETVAYQVLYSVELADTIDESSRSIHDSLKPLKLVLRSIGQQTVAVVDP